MLPSTLAKAMLNALENTRWVCCALDDVLMRNGLHIPHSWEGMADVPKEVMTAVWERRTVITDVPIERMYDDGHAWFTCYKGAGSKGHNKAAKQERIDALQQVIQHFESIGR